MHILILGMMLTTRGKRHVIKSWVLRYVVLSEGLLLFYEDYDEENEEPGTRHGVMVLIVLNCIIYVYVLI